MSDNPNERLGKEIPRRTDVVGTFPDRDPVTRLVGTVLAEQHDERAEGRRHFALDVLARARLSLITGTEEDADQPLTHSLTSTNPRRSASPLPGTWPPTGALPR